FDFEGILRIDTRDPLAKVVGSRVGLLEIVGQSGQEVREAETSARSVKREVSILVEAGDGVVLHTDQVEPKSHLMPASDHIHVIGHLEAVDVEMSGRASTTERAEPAGHGQQQEVRHSAVHIDPKHSGVDWNIRWPAVVT